MVAQTVLFMVSDGSDARLTILPRVLGVAAAFGRRWHRSRGLATGSTVFARSPSGAPSGEAQESIEQ